MWGRDSPGKASFLNASPTQDSWSLFSRLSWGEVEGAQSTPQETEPGPAHTISVYVGQKSRHDSTGSTIQDLQGWNLILCIFCLGSSSKLTDYWQNSIPCNCRIKALCSYRLPVIPYDVAFSITCQFASSKLVRDTKNLTGFWKAQSPLRAHLNEAGPLKIISLLINKELKFN